jgi:dTDP-4-amino-4,6-dideoxygalactose transaminase
MGIMNTIPFNVPCVVGNELEYIARAINTHKKLAGDGPFTKQCHEYFERTLRVPRALLTTSCTSALEMAALLLDIQPNDEVIVPSFTFVSSANAFALRRAKLVFADSAADNPNIDVGSLESLISPRTRAIVVVHYAGVACDMDKIMSLATRYNLDIVEDAAQAIDSYYKDQALGTFGRFAAFSFHETKNVVCGEGGLLTVNRKEDVLRAEIIREKGTNRSAFFRGEVDKYGWVDIGSSYLPSELNAAYLWAQLEALQKIQSKRKLIWKQYAERLKGLANVGLQLPNVPNNCTVNGHMFYLVCPSLNGRSDLIRHLKNQGIAAVFHYLSLHSSEYFRANHDGRALPNSDRFSDCLVRLPLHYELTETQVDYVCDSVLEFYKQ